MHRTCFTAATTTHLELCDANSSERICAIVCGVSSRCAAIMVMSAASMILSSTACPATGAAAGGCRLSCNMLASSLGHIVPVGAAGGTVAGRDFPEGGTTASELGPQMPFGQVKGAH